MKTKDILILIFILIHCESCSTDEPNQSPEPWPEPTEEISYEFKQDHFILVSAPELDTVVIADKLTYEGKDYPVTEIGETAFKGNTKVETLYLPSSITQIGLYAFQNTHIKEIHIEDLESWLNILFHYYFNASITQEEWWTYSNPL